MEETLEQPTDLGDALAVTPPPALEETDLVGLAETGLDGEDADLDADPDEENPFVFAIGRIEPRFPTAGVEKEFARARARANTTGLTDRQALYRLLQDPQNEYLARQLHWVFKIEEQDTYLLYPNDPIDFDRLIKAVRPIPRPGDVDLIIGLRDTSDAAGVLSGPLLPVVVFDQIYSFDVASLVGNMPQPEGSPANFTAAGEELLYHIMRLPDNHGATNEHRALNFLAVRYPPIHARTAEAHTRNLTLADVEVVPSRLSQGTREVVDVIFRYTNRDTGAMERYFVRVDVTEEFPFLISRLLPYFNR